MTREFKILVYLSLLLLGFMVATPVANQGVKYVAPIVKVDLVQLACMAKNIFYEAASESVLGQAAVARVVMNRVAHGFAKTPCKVIYQSTDVEKIDEEGETNIVKVCQFSWVCADVPPISTHHPAYKQAEKIAHDVLVNNAYKEVLPDSVLFFHSILIEPNWSYRQMKIIGNHLFYARGKRPKQVAEPVTE